MSSLRRLSFMRRRKHRENRKQRENASASPCDSTMLTSTVSNSLSAGKIDLLCKMCHLLVNNSINEF